MPQYFLQYAKACSLLLFLAFTAGNATPHGYILFEKSCAYYPYGDEGPSFTLDIGDGTKIVTNAYLGYIPGDLNPNNPGNVAWIFNTSMTPPPGYACHLLNYENDWPTPNVITASDSGNDYTEFWKTTKNVPTFIIEEVGKKTGIIGHTYCEFVIHCFYLSQNWKNIVV
eukprot:m.309931 g.309931  ORF g.309931 m.309931 type:complete len:169 (+) comp48596_c0_seq1:136-642(+)